MAFKRATPLVWMMVVAVAAIMVAENGRLCSAFDMGEAKDSMMNKAEEAKDKASSWSNWAYSKISGKLSLDPDEIKKSDDKVGSSSEIVSGKVHVVSHNGDMKDDTSRFYNQAKHDVGASYDDMAKKPVTLDD